MKTRGAKKISIYLDETEKFQGRPVYEAVLELCRRRQIAGASLFRGLAGYGGRRVLHTAKILELSTNLPVKIEIIDSAAAIDAALPEISALVQKGLVEVSETMIIDRD